MINKVEICGVDTSKLPRLTNAEMMDMLRRIQAGEPGVRDAFIKGNLRLVLSVIQRFIHRGENLDDLFQVGCIGLIKAIDNFDMSHGVRFSTYAVPMIIGEIRRFLRDNNAIRVSRSLRDVAYKALQVREQLTAATGREPTLAEIAEKLELPAPDVAMALDAIQEPISLFEPVYHDGGDAVAVMDQVGDDRSHENRWMDGIALREALGKLDQREQHILFLRFYEGRTQMEVAKEIGISQAQVSRLEKNALSSMRRFL